jgi:group II intron reverse transcriptase/maturase
MAKGDRESDREQWEVRAMRTAETVLAVIRRRGERKLPLDDVYRQLFNPALYLHAYGKIYRKRGAMTRGTTSETVDGMSQAKIANIIEAIRFERYRWTPVRRTYIEKQGSTKKRPLGIPTWSDKLLQEVIRMILEAYFEPQFSPHSHGFRPGRGCHTALTEIQRTWKGTVWFIEGDISGCFDTIDHAVLMGILGEKIRDNRFLRLIANLLKAGYLEDWRYHATPSGTPQGGIVSPILANIYLERLDAFVKDTLVPAFNRGTNRKWNRAYTTLARKRYEARHRGDQATAKALFREMRKLPSRDTTDPDYRRLRYLRYADDFLLGFAGPRAEAEAIKRHLGEFLRRELHLELSVTKTLITHGSTEAARFLGYELTINRMEDRLFKTGNHSQRCNGKVALLVPRGTIEAKMKRYCRKGKPAHRAERLNDSAFDIIVQYQQEYRGLAQYFALAANRSARFRKLRWAMEGSLAKTLANKLKISVAHVYRRYGDTIVNEHGTYRGLRVTVPRAGKAPLTAHWGGISLERPKNALTVVIDDRPVQPRAHRTELVQRLMADTCELCGSTVDVQVHHIRKLSDLRKPGQKELPIWKQRMIARQRKTLVLCLRCHRDVHAGRLNRKPDMENWRAG